MEAQGFEMKPFDDTISDQRLKVKYNISVKIAGSDFLFLFMGAICVFGPRAMMNVGRGKGLPIPIAEQFLPFFQGIRFKREDNCI